jgi:starch-binding outer membrane protein, SusD/RagB family
MRIRMKIGYTPKLLLTALAILVAGCGDYLEENPDNRVELNTTKKAAQLLTNAYSNGGYTFTEWMSDNVSYTTGTVKLPEHNQLYTWEDVTTDNQDTPTNFWTATYDAIAHSNEVLAVIDKLPGERDEKRAVEGEALLTRAYGHFMLVNLFAKHYDPETASSDPGIPYVLEPETVFLKQYNRNSVEEVYDYVEDDFKRGLKLVDASFYANSGKYHFTREAALALASRFYLFKGDYENCIEYSTQLLANNPEVFVKDIERLLEETPNPDEFISAYTSPTDQSNLLMIRQITNFPVNVGYWPSPDLVRGLYNSNPWFEDDIRTSNEYPIYLRGTGWAIAKYEFLFERSSLTSNVGLYYTIMPVFRGEEVLLNRAESYVYTNNLALAVDDLQTLVNLRYSNAPDVTIADLRSYYGMNNDQAALLRYIIEERQKEFMHEGLRWFDIKRYQIPVTHFDESNFPMTLEGDDPRKVLQIPQAAIDVGGLEPNPR